MKPTMQERARFALGVFMFGIGLVAIAKGEYGMAYLDFGVSACWFGASLR